MIHKLKTWPQYWDAVKSGDKTFEVRRDDRGFQKGDILELLRSDGVKTTPPGGLKLGEALSVEILRSTIRKRITYILTGGQLGIEPGYVVLGLGEEAAQG